MASTPAHTPYDGSSKLFAIGLKPLDLDEWIEIDDTFDFHLAEKRRIHAQYGSSVFVEEPDTRAAQAEVLALLVDHLPARHAQHYKTDGARLTVAGQPEIGAGLPPLHIASLLVQEDLILMRKSAEGWRLVAGALCFPSSWSLTEKFGKTMQDIHIPVPAFGPGTRMAGMIERIFDNLAVELPVERYNWSIQAGDALYHPLSDEQRIDRATMRPSRFNDKNINASAFIRVERQTLRKLPVSGDILFTIRIFLDPLAVLSRHDERKRIAISFAAQLAALDEAQLDYKGLTGDRDRLVSALERLAGL
ncbi:hypothetical protein ASD50_12740 [Mesorhizobium sp. Root552]|uniref:heme-dependent oxidative N-demethylase family protein n=1 Tax=Mesorhizobium sp. Root552 TaxID=1736555 RepID=UPI0006F5343E|nr:DUF3445 domain-containing protein [Mesorhizobium sp. Root552]KQZ12236.1 hypothetical protein ASD50_12740 [Mesorhizobium sp. Root552]